MVSNSIDVLAYKLINFIYDSIHFVWSCVVYNYYYNYRSFHDRVDSVQVYPVPSQFPGAIDDVIMFAWAIHRANMTMYLCNKKHYGYLMDQVCTQGEYDHVLV